MQSEPHDILSDMPSSDSDQPNTVALIGVILSAAAGLLCVWLFLAAGGIPVNSPLDSESTGKTATDSAAADERPADSASQAAARLRILLLASAAAVLNFVGLALCLVGLLLPNRPRAMALAGLVGSFLLLVGVFGTIAVGALLSPA